MLGDICLISCVQRRTEVRRYHLATAGRRRHSRFLATAGRITALAAPLASMSFLQHTPHGEHEETDDNDADDDVRWIH